MKRAKSTAVLPAAAPVPRRTGERTRLRTVHPARANSVAGTESLANRIYDTIFQSMMARRLLPGTKLPEAALCQLFGAGRTTVQKALQKLAHDHIVELRPNRGAIVAMPTAAETAGIFEARQALEAAIVSLAASKATAADVALLRLQLEEEHSAVHAFVQADWARLASNFHLRIATLARNPVLERYLNELVSRCSLIVALHEPAGHASCEHEEHRAILDAIERGDAVAAAAAMKHHLQELERHVQLVSSKPRNDLAEMLGMDRLGGR